MKLKDFLTERRETAMIGKIPIVHTKEPLTRMKKGEEGVKSGSFARVAPHRSKEHPNTVVKVSTIDEPEKSHMVKFFNIALEHQDNPFFPRIYSAKIHKYDDPKSMIDRYKIVLTMERLHEISKKNINEVAKHLFAQLGITDEELVEIKKELGITHNPLLTFFHNIQLSLMIENDRFRKKITQESKNPKFKEAMQLLEPLISGPMQDLHAENWMIRLTGHGPQLVIIDPVID